MADTRKVGQGVLAMWKGEPYIPAPGGASKVNKMVEKPGR
jgi:hypothetical protein